MNKKKRQFLVVVFRGKEGRFITDCPYIPGCTYHAETEAEAIMKTKEALKRCVETQEMIKAGNASIVKLYQIEVLV